MIVGMSNDRRYAKLRDEAIRLRKQGLSYNEIRKEVNVAKSTLSLWLKSILLRPDDRKRLYTKQIQILSKGPASQKERRIKEIEEIIERAEREIKLPLSDDAYRLMGASLYWAEGSKGKMFELTNSDPHLILFFARWVESMFGIAPKNLKARLNIYPQQSEMKIKKFWSDLTDIPLGNFGKSYIKPPNKGYKKNNLYYGTMRIEVPKSANIRHRVYGWIKAVLSATDSDVRLVQRRWLSLRKTPRPVNMHYKNIPPIA